MRDCTRRFARSPGGGEAGPSAGDAPLRQQVRKRPCFRKTGTRLGTSYKDAGVDIEAGDALVERIKPLAAKTRRPELLSGVGGFGGLFALPPGRYKEPVLVSGTDGVGTKLKVAFALDQHDT